MRFFQFYQTSILSSHSYKENPASLRGRHTTLNLSKNLFYANQFYGYLFYIHNRTTKFSLEVHRNNLICAIASKFVCAVVIIN